MPPRRKPAVAEALLADQSLAPGSTPIGADHLGVGARLIDEDELFGIKLGLVGLPVLSRFGHVCTPGRGNPRPGVQLYFEADLVAREEPPDRHLGRLHSQPLDEPPADLGQGQIPLPGDEVQKPRRMRLQR